MCFSTMFLTTALLIVCVSSLHVETAVPVLKRVSYIIYIFSFIFIFILKKKTSLLFRLDVNGWVKWQVVAIAVSQYRRRRQIDVLKPITLQALLWPILFRSVIFSFPVLNSMVFTLGRKVWLLYPTGWVDLPQMRPILLMVK